MSRCPGLRARLYADSFFLLPRSLYENDFAESRAQGDKQRSMGPEQHPHGRDRRPHVQRRRLHGDHADAVEAAERSRQELAARLQGPHAPRVPHQNRQRKGRPAVQGEHLRHPDAQRCVPLEIALGLFFPP